MIHALLVGIDRYRMPGPTLRGRVNDVRLAESAGMCRAVAAGPATGATDA